MKTAMLGILLIAGCSRLPDPAGEADKLLATDIEFAKKSVESGAAEAFHAFLDADAIQFPANSLPVRGNDSIYAMMKGGTSVLRWTPREAHVSASGDLGYTWGYYTVTPADSSPPRHGKYVNVWKKQPGGLWKVVIDIGNPGPAAPDLK